MFYKLFLKLYKVILEVVNIYILNHGNVTITVYINSLEDVGGAALDLVVRHLQPRHEEEPPHHLLDLAGVDGAAAVPVKVGRISRLER